VISKVTIYCDNDSYTIAQLQLKITVKITILNELPTYT